MAERVSIIIPTYNRSERIRESVLGVLDQTWRPLEIVVVNDGSTDGTRETLDSLKSEWDAPDVELRIIHKRNGGVSTARNEGIRNATGDFVNFLDDDDRLFPDKLKRQVACIRENGADAACCRLARVTPDGEGLHPSKKKSLISGLNPADYIRGNSYAHVISLLVATGKVREAGMFNEELSLGEDVEWVARLVHVAKFCAIEEPLGRYEYTEDSASRVRSGDDLLQYDNNFERVLDLMFEHNHGRDNWDQTAWKERVARDFEQFIKHQLYAENRKRAAELYAKGLRLVGPCKELRKARRKMRKARWLALFGKRVKHPQFGRFEDIRN